MTETTNTPDIDRVVNFLNSRGVGFEQGEDLLADAASARRLLAALGDKQHADPSPQALDELRRLRDAVSALLAENEDTAKAAAALDNLAANRHFRYRFRPELQVRLEPVEKSAVAQILEDVAGLVASGRWDRVKTCANEDCGAVFYDPTRAKTRRWHAFEICGNKKNVAAFRQRAAGAV
jgi:predicted RNA-binding Zn ribbon-like protein